MSAVISQRPLHPRQRPQQSSSRPVVGDFIMSNINNNIGNLKHNNNNNNNIIDSVTVQREHHSSMSEPAEGITAQSIANVLFVKYYGWLAADHCILYCIASVLYLQHI